MSIVRKIKLEQLGYYTCKDNTEKELFKFIKENLLNLTEIKLEEYPDSILYFKNDKCVFEYDSNMKIVFINLQLNYIKEIENVIKYYYKLLFNHISCGRMPLNYWNTIENNYKNISEKQC